MKDIYIILSNTKSLPSRLIHLVTRHDYAHVSISTDETLHKMYSFGRKYLYFPWYGGFVSESIYDGMFARNKKSKIAVYRLSVDEETYDKVNSGISDYTDHRKELFYDYIGIVGMKIGKDLFRPNGYVCSSFTHEILTKSGVALDKNRWEIYPVNFAEIDGAELVYEGFANAYSMI